MLRQSRSRIQPGGSAGYTKAVDMWAVGCVAVILLTGGMAFSDPMTGMYSERMARDCDLDFLRTSADWHAVRQRPREFVERLLVADEQSRMTAEEGLQHPWFCNEAHKNDFEELYQRTVKYWRPRQPKSPIVDFQDDGTCKYLAYKLGFLDFYHKLKSGNRKHIPVEPPYKPFPRKMHLAFWPKREEKNRLSPEVLSAIGKWSPKSAVELASRNVELQALSAQDASDLENRRNTNAWTALPCFPSTVFKSTATEQVQMAGQGRRTPAKWGEKTAGRPSKPELVAGHPRAQEAYPDIIEKSQAALIPNALYDKTNWWKPANSPLTEKRSVLPGSDAPSTTRKLKRRASTALTASDQRRSKRRGSIFDLAEDGDSDSEKPRMQPARARLRTPPRVKLVSTWKTDLYLPR